MTKKRIPEVCSPSRLYGFTGKNVSNSSSAILAVKPKIPNPGMQMDICANFFHRAESR